MLDISISSYGNKGNKQFRIKSKVNRNFAYPMRSNSFSNRYLWKVNNWIARHEYHKAQGKIISLAEDYYTW